MGSQKWVLLNSHRVAHEIINKRASVTNERPDFPIANDIVSDNARVVLRQMRTWQDARKVMHPLLNGTSIKAYAPILENESLLLLQNYLEHPRDWYVHNFQYGYRTIHQIVVGQHSGHSSLQLHEFQRVTVEFLRYINASLVDYFPILHTLPKALQCWRPYWEQIGADHKAVLDAWREPVRQSIAEGRAPDSFIKSLIQTHSKFSTNESEALQIATSIVEAGSDNVRMGLNALTMVAIDQPHVVSKVRAEIDGVCGTSELRLPTIADMDRLPYVLATIKECLRWRPNIPIAIIPQHRLIEDLEFEEYRFQAGTDFLVNSAAVSRECAHPDLFMPERWLGESPHHNSSIISGLWSFGGGHRICVGYKIAQQELFIAFSRLLYCFEFESVCMNCLQG